MHTAAIGRGHSDGNTGSPCSSARTLQQDGLRVSVSVAPGEPCSVGTFDIVASFRDGGTQHFQAEHDGTIANVWLVDVTADGTLDLVITTTSAGSGAYGTVLLYVQTAQGFVVHRVSPLTADQKKGYMGHDGIELRNGQLFRSFPLYRRGDTSAAPSGDTASYRYSLRQRAWVN